MVCITNGSNRNRYCQAERGYGNEMFVSSNQEVGIVVCATGHGKRRRPNQGQKVVEPVGSLLRAKL